MWKPPTPAEQELWNAVVSGVHAVERMDRNAVEAAVDRLTALPGAWVRRALETTAGLLTEELHPGAEELWPLVAVQVERLDTWLPGVDRQLLALLLSDRHPSPGLAAPAGPEYTRHLLLLIACLSEMAQAGVGAFVDVALVGDDRPRARPLSGLVPHHRIGR